MLEEANRSRYGRIAPRVVIEIRRSPSFVRMKDRTNRRATEGRITQCVMLHAVVAYQREQRAQYAER